MPSLISMLTWLRNAGCFELTRTIRELESESGSHTPIIGVTAHAMEGAEDECIAAGMDDYVSKPVSPAKFKEALEKWLNGDDQDFATMSGE